MDAVPSARAVTAARTADAPEERLHPVSARPFVLRTLEQQHVDARGSRTAKVLVLAADAGAITAAMVLAVWIRYAATGDNVGSVSLAGALAIPVWLCAFARYKLYTAAAVTSVTGELRRLIHAVAAGAVCTTIVAVLIGIESPRAWVLLLFATALPLVIIERSIVRRIFRRAREHGRLRRHVVVIGTNAEAIALVQMLAATPGLGYEVLGLIDCGDGPGVPTSVPVLGDWRDATDIVTSVGATGALIASERDRQSGREPARPRAERDRLPRRDHVRSGRHLRRPAARPPAGPARGRSTSSRSAGSDGGPWPSGCSTSAWPPRRW